MTVVAIQRIRNGVPTSATQATLSIVNSAGAVVLPTTVIAPTSAGSYSYENASLVAGSYTATWVFTTTGLPTDTISRAFTVDSAVEVSEGVTLMELERMVARRTGPYWKRRVGASSTVNSIVVPRLKSSLDLGDYEGMTILRRGLTYGDELVSNFDSDDRIRLVDTYDANLGTLAPDRAYDVAPIDGEAIELHSFDPEDELRPCVLDGLKRCFFWETLSISVTGSGVYNIDLTASAPWLTNPTHLRDVSLSYPSQLLPPRRMQWWEPYRSGKSLKLYTKGGAVGSVTLQVLRPIFSLVNGEMSLSGPNDDLDVVYGDPDYMAWAGVLEMWKNHGELIAPLAAQGMRPSREDAANAFTTKSLLIQNQMPERRQVDYGVPDIVQIGNLAEPVS